MTKIVNLGLAIVGVALATFASSSMMNANGRVYDSPCTDGGNFACTIMDIGNGQFKVLRWGTLIPPVPVDPIKLDPWTPVPPIDVYVPIKKNDFHLVKNVGDSGDFTYAL